MSKQTQQAVAKQEANVPAPYIGSIGDFGFDQAETKDIKMPLIYVAQGQSKLVDQGVAKNGDIVENLENQVLAPKGSSLRLIPFFFQKSYQVSRVENGKKTFVGNEPWDGDREYEEVKMWKDKTGKEVPTTFFNTPTFNFFVFRENDPNFTRYVIAFRGSRNINKGGKILLSQLMSKLQGATPQAPYNFLAEVGIEQVENEKGKWYIMNAKIARDPNGNEMGTDQTTRERAAKAAADIKAMFQKGMKLDTSDVETTSGEEEQKDNF